MTRLFAIWIRKYVCTLLGRHILERIPCLKQFSKSSKTTNFWGHDFVTSLKFRAPACSHETIEHILRCQRPGYVIFPRERQKLWQDFPLRWAEKATLSGTSRTVIPPSFPRCNNLKRKPHPPLGYFQIKPSCKQPLWPFSTSFSIAFKHKI